MQHDLYHAQDCRCGHCAPGLTRADAIWSGIAIVGIALLGLSVDPVMTVIASFFL